MLLSILTFILITILLYSSSKALTNHLLKLFFHITKSQNISIKLIFFLYLPGIFLHELSHILSATLLGVPTGKLSLRPRFVTSSGLQSTTSSVGTKDSSKPSQTELSKLHLQLGSAQIGSCDPIRLTLIGTAPFINGTIILWLLLTIGLHLDLSTNLLSQLPLLTSLPCLTLFAVGYLVFAISNTMFSSPSDLQSAGFPVFLLLFLFGIFQLTNLNPPQLFLTFANNLFSTLSVIFVIVLATNLLTLLPLKLLTKKW